MRLLRKKADPPQQPAPLPTVQNPSSAPPPLFARFASTQPTGTSSSSPRIISGPVPLAPRNSLHKQTSPHDGSPPKPASSRVVSTPVQRNRLLFEEQVNGDGRDDKPLPDPEQSPPRRVNPRASHREQARSFGSRISPMNTDDLSQEPPKPIAEFRRRDDPRRNAEFASVSLDAPSTSFKTEGAINKLSRTKVSSSPERKPSARPAPVPEPQPSPMLTAQNPPDRPQPRRKYSPLEAFGLVSGENSPVPSTTTSSVNLPSQNSVSASSGDSTLPSFLAITIPWIKSFDTELTTLLTGTAHTISIDH